jgi:hypothetical protein
MRLTLSIVLLFLIFICCPKITEAISYKDKIAENQRAVNSLKKAIVDLKSSMPRIGSVPVGTIVAYWGKVAPEGWLMCDGSIIDEKHFELRSLVGKNAPNLQGYFLRGFDPKGKVDPEGKKRIIGHKQKDQFQIHKHYRKDKRGRMLWKSGYLGVSGDDVLTHSHYFHKDKPLYTGGPYIGSFGEETRPKNIAVNFIIKY